MCPGAHLVATVSQQVQGGSKPSADGGQALTWGDAGGRCRIRTCVGVSRRIYSPSTGVPLYLTLSH
jgi:hypothetical protein